MERWNIKGLELNYSKGFESNNDFTFLESLSFLIELDVIDDFVEDISAVNSLHHLKNLRITTYCKTEIDFSKFPDIEHCSIVWRPLAKSIFNSTSLKTLIISDLAEKESNIFKELINLEMLTLYDAQLREIDNFRYLTNLTELRLYGCKNLTSLKGIENLTKLKILEIENCRKIYKINELENLTDLRELNISNNYDIETLTPLKNLENLEKIFFYEQSNILDGNVEILKSLPKLKDVRFQKRSHYNLSVYDFPFRKKDKRKIEKLQKKLDKAGIH